MSKEVLDKTKKTAGLYMKDIKDEKPYEFTAVKAAAEMKKLINKVKKSLQKINIPTWIFKSIEDHIVHFKSAGYTYDRISSLDKEIIWLKNSYHVATMDYDKDIIVDQCKNFIKRLIKK